MTRPKSLLDNPRPDNTTEVTEVDTQIRDTLLPPVDVNGAIRVEEAHVTFENNSVKNSDIRNFRPGNGTVTFGDGEYTVSTAATATSRQALETARLGQYNAGLPGAVGLLVAKQETPVGYAEWGYGGQAFDNELRFHLKSDGTYRFDRIRGGVQTEIPRDLWAQADEPTTLTDENGAVTGEVVGRDRLDGAGPSGVEIEPPFIGLFGVDFVLYGGGGFAPWIVDLTTDGTVGKVYPFVFHPLRESVLTQFNQPIFGRLDNDGTPASDAMIVAERQFTSFGIPSENPRDTAHFFDLDKSVNGPTALFGWRRRTPDSPVPVQVADIVINIDSDAHLYYLANPDIESGDTEANWQNPAYNYAGNTAADSETTLEVNEDLTVDPTTGIPIPVGHVPSGKQTKVAASIKDIANSVFIRDRPVVLMCEGQPGKTPSSQQGAALASEQF